MIKILEFIIFYSLALYNNEYDVFLYMSEEKKCAINFLQENSQSKFIFTIYMSIHPHRRASCKLKVIIIIQFLFAFSPCHFHLKRKAKKKDEKISHDREKTTFVFVFVLILLIFFFFYQNQSLLSFLLKYGNY
jgi:hypothetical protein